MKKPASKHIRLDLIMLSITFGLQTLMEIILSVNSILATDIAYKETIFPDIATTAVSILEVTAMSAGLSLICVALFMGKKRFLYLPIFAAASLYRRVLASTITLLIDELSVGDLLMSLSVFILDITVLSIATLIIDAFAKRYRSVSVDTKVSALFSDGELVTKIDPIYPFKKIYGKGNLLQSALLSIGILLSAVMIISRTAGIIIAPPENIPMTIVGYIGDILIVPLSYAISCFLLSWLYSKNEKRAAMRQLFKED